jgi:hypothetical protein
MKRIFLLLLALGLFWPNSGVVSVLPAQQPAAQLSGDAQTETVYITRTGKRYHRDGCRYLSQNKIKTTVKEAQASGYTPYKVCRPPE